MAGRATRLPGLSCSKEILPVAFSAASVTAAPQPQAVCEHVLTSMQRCGIREVYLVIRDGKWDIPAHLGDGSQLGLQLAYLMMGLPWGAPYSVDQAYAFARDRRVALGFPDMCFADHDVFRRTLAHQEASGADVVLGIFPAARPDKVDMVEIDKNHHVKEILIKPGATRLRHTWGLAVWTPAFTEFLHTFLLSHRLHAERAPELFLGDVIRAGIGAGLNVQGVEASKQAYLDIGTPEDLAKAAGSDPEQAQ